MVYDSRLAERVREYLADIPNLDVTEKEMFGGLAFLVNDKMCINIGADSLMLRFEPQLQEELAEKNGYEAVVMKGRSYKGYCYIHPEGFKAQEDFEYFVNICLDYNKMAKKSKRKTSKR